MTQRFRGLIAATHTPFTLDGSLALGVVERQAEALLADGVTAVFVGGSTGECHSLTLDERLRLAARWAEVARGTALRVIVHVGSNCLADARTLAAQAEQLGASAIAAHSPSYFKPSSVAALVACCADIAAAAPGTPFYFYDIPVLTGVNLPMPEFLERGAEDIPTLAGLKFTNPDFVAFQLAAAVAPNRFEILWGLDEMLLPALAVGAAGAVGSTWNFAAPLYQQLIEAFERGDILTARREQMRSVRLIQILGHFGFLPASKAFMESRGVPVGPPRLPFRSLSVLDRACLLGDLSGEGFVLVESVMPC
jgi:N-acetylneuraminate lyase